MNTKHRVKKLIQKSGSEAKANGKPGLAAQLKVRDMPLFKYLEEAMPTETIEHTIILFDPKRLSDYIEFMEPACSVFAEGMIPIATEPNGDSYLVQKESGELHLCPASLEDRTFNGVKANSLETFHNVDTFFEELLTVLDID